MLQFQQSAQNCGNSNLNSVQEHKMFMEKVAIYLKLISEATLVLSKNEGTLRRDIWAYLLEYYGKMDDTIDYRDFLLSIRNLLQQGKLLSD